MGNRGANKKRPKIGGRKHRARAAALARTRYLPDQVAARQARAEALANEASHATFADESADEADGNDSEWSGVTGKRDALVLGADQEAVHKRARRGIEHAAAASSSAQVQPSPPSSPSPPALAPGAPPPPATALEPAAVQTDAVQVPSDSQRHQRAARPTKSLRESRLAGAPPRGVHSLGGLSKAVREERDRKKQADKVAAQSKKKQQASGATRSRERERTVKRHLELQRMRDGQAALKGVYNKPTVARLLAVYASDRDELSGAEVIKLIAKTRTVFLLCKTAVSVGVRFSRSAIVKERAALDGLSEDTVGKWWREFLGHGFKFLPIMTGKVSNAEDMLRDRDVMDAARRWVRVNRVRKGRPNMTVQEFMDYLNELLKPCLAETVQPGVALGAAEATPEPGAAAATEDVDAADASEEADAADAAAESGAAEKPGTGRLVSLERARVFLHELGFSKMTVGKDVYFDGHERPDVVAYRNEVYLPKMLELEPRMDKYLGAECNEVEARADTTQREVVLVVHDECAFAANDDEKHIWMEHGRPNTLRPKNEGPCYHASGFLSEKMGVLRVPEAIYKLYEAGKLTLDGEAVEYNEKVPRVATAYMKVGKLHAGTMFGIAHEGYWTSDLFVKQLDFAITIFELSHPGCQGLFQVDNATGHSKYADDALVVSSNRMNLNPGGEVQAMRDTAYDDKPQSMVFCIGDELLFDFKITSYTTVAGKKKASGSTEYKQGTILPAGHALLGKPKGIKMVLMERGLWRAGLKLCCKPKTAAEKDKDEDLRRLGRSADIVLPHSADMQTASGVAAQPCCATWALANCPDFKNQMSEAEELIAARGHLSIFVPKFHPELNFIERFWGANKRHLRQICGHKLQKLIPNVTAALSGETGHCSLTDIRKFARHSWRWMAAYRRGLTGRAAEFVMKRYKGHRHIPAALDEALLADVARLQSEDAADDAMNNENDN